MRIIYIAAATLSVAGCVSMPSPSELRQRQAEMDLANHHLQRAIAAKFPVYVNSRVVSPPNSVGGVSVMYSLRNIASKPIKYVTLSLMPYNSVGDVVSSDIGRKSLALAEFTGPLAPSEFTYPTWKNLWYNQTISCVQLEAIEVVFMDGETQKIDKQGVGAVFSTSLSNSCKV